MPRSREYFETFRPGLVASEVAQKVTDYLADLGCHILPEGVPRRPPGVRKAGGKFG